MEGHCSTGQSPHWAVVPMEEEEKERKKKKNDSDDGISRGRLFVFGQFPFRTTLPVASN